MRKHGLSWVAALCAATASACAPDFIEQWEVTKPRLSIAKIIVDGDTEGRSRPQPGETFSIHFYMLSPERPQTDYTADVTICAGTTLPDGTLACYQEIPLSGLGAEPYQGDDELVISGLMVPPLPDDLPPPFDTIASISMFGAMCVDGQVERVPGKSPATDAVPSLFECTDNDHATYQLPLPFTLSVGLDRGQTGSLNHNPSFACAEDEPDSPCHQGVEHEVDDEILRTPGAIVLQLAEEEADGEARELVWEPSGPVTELPWDNCAETELTKVHANGDANKIFVRLDASDRESYEREVKVNGEPQTEARREELVVSHAITTKGGKLSSFSSVLHFEEEDAKAEVDFEYAPPHQSDKADELIPDSGRLVRFFFTVRDQRGGVDFTTRELCILPPKD